MIKFLQKLFWRKPSVGLVPRAVHLNPSHGEHVARHGARIARLREAIDSAAAGAYRDGLQVELDRRLATMTAAGLEA